MNLRLNHPMPLPEKMSANLEKELARKVLLDTSLAKEVTADLEEGRPIKWHSRWPSNCN